LTWEEQERQFEADMAMVAKLAAKMGITGSEVADLVVDMMFDGLSMDAAFERLEQRFSQV
jgi:hypothetical protein